VDTIVRIAAAYMLLRVGVRLLVLLGDIDLSKYDEPDKYKLLTGIAKVINIGVVIIVCVRVLGGW